MTLRSSHGRARELSLAPRVEVLPVDELPDGVPAPASPPVPRNSKGQLVPGPGTTELARSGGKAAGESKQLARLLGLWTPPDDHVHAPYARLGREWRDAHMAELGRTVAGGKVGPGPASVVSSAALQLAASRFLFDEGAKAGDSKMLLEAARLADASRQNLLAAHELAAREAAARGRPANHKLAAIEAAGAAVAERDDDEPPPAMEPGATESTP